MKGYTLLLVAVLGCSRLDERINSRGHTRYTELLNERAHAGLTLGKCGMFGPTRQGYCLARTSPATWPALERSLGLTPGKPEETFKNSCLDFDGYGRKVADSPEAREALPGVRMLVKGAVPLPPNTDNVHFVALYLNPSGSELCFEYQYPYG